MVHEISPEEARQCCDKKNAIVIDVRESSEWNEGHIPWALHIPRGTLEQKIAEIIPNKSSQIICQCRSGKRSFLAAETLGALGYTNTSSLRGGIEAWKEKGFPVTSPNPVLNRYARHIALSEVGEAGQQKLLKSKVLIIGAGGLGSPAAMYLAATGIGAIGLVDDDVVDETNLQRQIIHTTPRLGISKVTSAKETLNALNPSLDIRAHEERLSAKNVTDLFQNYDIIVDGSDNFPTHYLINDACVLLQKPFVFGSVYQFEGHISLFWPGKGPCYRCLYPAPPPVGTFASCREAGVLGVVPGVIGTLQATEVIKMLLEKKGTLLGRLLCYNALEATFREFDIPRNPDCTYCAPGKKFPGFARDEEFVCG